MARSWQFSFPLWPPMVTRAICRLNVILIKKPCNMLQSNISISLVLGLGSQPLHLICNLVLQMQIFQYAPDRLGVRQLQWLTLLKAKGGFMYIYPKKLESITHKITRLPKSRLDKAKEWLFELKQGLKDFFSSAPLWQWVIGSIVIFGAYTYFKGYFPNFWQSFNPLYR